MNLFHSEPRRLRANTSKNTDPMIFKLARGALLLVVWVIVALSPARSFTQELLRVPYGVTTSLQHLPILVGKDSGLFSKYGLNIEPVHIRGGALITTMIMSG